MVLTLEKFNKIYKQLETIDSSEFGNSEDDSIQEKMSSVFAQLSLDELDEFEKMLKERSAQRNLSAFFRAQKGGAYVHLGMGAYSTRLVSVLDGGSVLLIAYKKPNR